VDPAEAGPRRQLSPRRRARPSRGARDAFSGAYNQHLLARTYTILGEQDKAIGQLASLLRTCPNARKPSRVRLETQSGFRTMKQMVALAAVVWCGVIPIVPPEPTPGPSTAQDTLTLVLAADGNEARYRVREQLANLDFPNDAVGVTSAITGQLVLDATGRVVTGASTFVIDVTTLKSDKERRDGYLQRRTLETAQYPTVTLVPTALRGLPWPLPSSGTFAFEMEADLTIKAVTRTVRWQVEAVAADGAFSGRMSTSFPFEAFELTQPRVSVVLSVENEIRLEYDFRLVPAKVSGS
jgi:polyisoprenoid-binding protein YceI